VRRRGGGELGLRRALLPLFLLLLIIIIIIVIVIVIIIIIIVIIIVIIIIERLIRFHLTAVEQRIKEKPLEYYFW